MKRWAVLACLGWVVTARAADSPDITQVDAIVVLGHRPARDSHGVEYETRARVEHAISLLRARRSDTLLMTGGASIPDVVEADVMAEHAKVLGAAPTAILRERASHDTIENARFSLALLRERVGHARKPRILLVTSDYHSERASRLFLCAGAEVEASPVTLSLPFGERLARTMREWLVHGSYLFMDECERARNG